MLAASGACFSARPRFNSAGLPAFDNVISAQQLAADPLRPQCHLLPARNWMNDPDGPIFWNGNYHMFYQYNPGAAVWGNMHWAHAVSPDMVHWKHLPIALAPTPGGPDQDGCFTGSAVVQDGVVTFLYTGVKSVPPEQATLNDGNQHFLETQCLATSRDPELLHWDKPSAPVLLPPQNAKLTGFRDPFLWRDGKVWYMGIGSGERGSGGRVLLYQSPDLRHWDFLHPLIAEPAATSANRDSVPDGDMWECPDFFPLGNKHLLFYSTEHKIFWKSGEFDPKELVFHPQKQGMLDYGNLYAPKSQLLADNRRILWGWIPEARPEKEFSAAGWAGCMAFPRILSLDADGNLSMQFVPELNSLRGPLWSLPQSSRGSTHGDSANFQLVQPAAELHLRFFSKPFELRIACKDQPYLTVSFTPQNKSKELQIAGHSFPLPARADGTHEIRLFLDASVIESIADNSISFTTRIYRLPNAPIHFSLVDPTDPSAVADASLALWSLKPISSNRLTT
jgi:beta-fructofuranosidase